MTEYHVKTSNHTGRCFDSEQCKAKYDEVENLQAENEKLREDYKDMCFFKEEGDTAIRAAAKRERVYLADADIATAEIKRLRALASTCRSVAIIATKDKAMRDIALKDVVGLTTQALKGDDDG